MELPAGSIIYHLDRGDPLKLVNTIKRKFAVSGGFPYDLLVRGTRKEIESHLAMLFETLAHEGGYILDTTALMMQDINIDNVRIAIDYTHEHGVYSRSSATVRNTQETPASREICRPEPLLPGKRPPGVCIPWEEESRSYKQLSGDTELVRHCWKETDFRAYNYIWTTFLW